MVIVTGAGSGIGAGTARRFLQEGALVVLNGRREHKLHQTIAGFDAAKSFVCHRDAADSRRMAETFVTAEDVLPKVLTGYGLLPAVVRTSGNTGPWDHPQSVRTVHRSPEADFWGISEISFA